MTNSFWLFLFRVSKSVTRPLALSLLQLYNTCSCRNNSKLHINRTSDIIPYFLLFSELLSSERSMLVECPTYGCHTCSQIRWPCCARYAPGNSRTLCFGGTTWRIRTQCTQAASDLCHLFGR